jgi:5-methylcytosine-specific restriction enzyme B
VTSPQREVVGICRITKGLHTSDDIEQIEFEKIERLDKPVLYETMQNAGELATAEPIVSNQGSLFKLTEQENEVIRALIDEANPARRVEATPYTKQMALKEVFVPEAQFDEMLYALREKRNLILQGHQEWARPSLRSGWRIH